MRKLMPDPVAAHFNFLRTSAVTMIFAWLASFSGYAQFAGYRSIQDIAVFKKQFTTESAKVMSIACDFSQEKTLTALTEKITSKGKFWFKRSNKLRLEYTKPFVYLIVMNGDKMLVKDNQKENRINVKSNRLFQQVNRIMIDCVQGNILDSKDFTTRVFENGTTFLLEMTPVSKALQEFFQTILLAVDKKDYSAKSITMNEPMGDMTLILFERKKLNEPLPETLFTP
jgi:outer membrane lipoprotein-sorting protein